MHSKPFFLRLFSCLAVASLSVLTLPAQEEEPPPPQEQRDWSNPSGGSFGEAGNWDGGVPQPVDLGWFDLNSAGYTVDLDGDRSIGALQVANDNVVLNLNGHTLALKDSTTVIDGLFGTASLMIGRGLGEIDHVGSFTVNGGGILNLQGFTIGGTSGSEGTFIVEGPGTALNILGGTSSNNAILGYLGDATMLVRDGASVDFGGKLTMGRHAGATAELRLQGENTSGKFVFIDVGLRASSNLYVENGAELIGGSNNNGRIDIAARTHDSSMTVDGGKVEAGNVNLSFWRATGTLEVLNGGTMALTGYLRAAYAMESETRRSTGIITIDGEGSRLTTTGSLQLGGTDNSTSGDRGNTAILNVRNGGVFSTDTIIYAWSGSTIAVDGGTISAAQLRGVAGATLDVTLNSGEFGPLITVTGSAATTIDDMILQVALGDQFTASVNDVFVLLDYAALTGTFADYAEGGQIEVGGYVFDISYGSGENDAVSLSVSAIPEPATVALIFALLTLGVAVLRRRK